MLMKSRPYPIPYPADPGIDSGPAVGHQQQAVREDIPRIGFPKGVEQKTSQYGNEADVDVESVRTMPIRAMPVRAMPIRTKSVRTMPIRTMPIRAMPVRTELIRIKLIRHLVCSVPCGMPHDSVCSAPVHVSGSPGFPTLLKTANTEHQHAQIQNILPCIAPFDISPAERTFIDFLKKCTPSSIGSQGSLSTGIGAVRPLG